MQQRQRHARAPALGVHGRVVRQRSRRPGRRCGAVEGSLELLVAHAADGRERQPALLGLAEDLADGADTNAEVGRHVAVAVAERQLLAQNLSNFCMVSRWVAISPPARDGRWFSADLASPRVSCA